MWYDLFFGFWNKLEISYDLLIIMWVDFSFQFIIYNDFETLVIGGG